MRSVMSNRISKRRRIIQFPVWILFNSVLSLSLVFTSSSDDALANDTIIREAVTTAWLSDPIHSKNICRGNSLSTTQMDSLFHHDLKVTNRSYWNNELFLSNNTSQITFTTVMVWMFYGPSPFQDNISTGNSEVVENRSGIFTGVSSSYQGEDESFSVTSSCVASMYTIFYNASSAYCDLSVGDISSILDIPDMFATAHSLHGNVTPRDNTQSVVDMDQMFYDDHLLWDTSNALDMNRVFSSASSFIQTICCWDSPMAHNDDDVDAYGSPSDWQPCSTSSPCAYVVLLVASWILLYIYKMIHSMHRATIAIYPSLILLCFLLTCLKWILAASVVLTDTTIREAVNTWISNPNTVKVVYGPIQTWNTSLVTNMNSLFSYKQTFNEDLSGWDTSGVTSMNSMFMGARAFNGNVSSWNTKRVTDFSWMFSSATSFNGDLSLWDTSMVSTMYAMFYLAPSFNGNISLWKTIRVANMGAMFNGAASFNGVLSYWNMKSVRDTKNMFQDAVSFNRDLTSWDTSSVSDMNAMFAGASSFNGSLAFWDTSRVTDVSWMFSHASSYNRDFSSWNTSSLRNMVAVFYNATSFNSDLSSWDTSKVTNMVGMFNTATLFNRDLSSFNTSLVVDFGWMFLKAASFNNNLSSWDTSSVKNMKWTFYSATKFNRDLSKWKTSRVTDMNSMFYAATSFNGNIQPWDTSRVLDMSEMFIGAKAFNQTLCWNTSVALKANLFEQSHGSFSAITFPNCLPTPKPSIRPTFRSTFKPSIWPKPWMSYTSLLYGSTTSNLTFNHTSCPEGTKVVSIQGRAASWIIQLSATCDDKGNSVLGPWGQPQGSLEAVPPCTEGYNGWNITYGSYIGQIAFACASSSFNFLPPLGSGLAFGAGSTNHTLLSRNQSIIGFQVYYDSLGIRAIKFEYAELPTKGRCLNSIGDPTGRCPSKTDMLALLWGFLVMSGVFAIIGFIFARVRRRHRKMMFKAHDNILPLK